MTRLAYTPETDDYYNTGATLLVLDSLANFRGEQLEYSEAIGRMIDEFCADIAEISEDSSVDTLDILADFDEAESRWFA